MGVFHGSMHVPSGEVGMLHRTDAGHLSLSLIPAKIAWIAHFVRSHTHKPVGIMLGRGSK